MRRPSDALHLPVLLAVEIAMLLAVHRLRGVPRLAVDLADPWGWLQLSRPEDAVAGVLHLAVWVVTIWLLTSTLVYALARSSHVPAAVHAAARITAPAVRRTVERGLATGLIAGVLTGPLPAAAQPAPPPADVTVLTEDGGFLPPGLQPPATVATEPSPAPPSHAAEVPPAAPPTAPSAPSRSSTAQVTVEPGDNLWVIAERHLADTVTGTQDVARYWRDVVETNRQRLRSGDPDLIHPGEVVELPPPTRNG